MNLKPVKNISKPKYPDKTEIELNRALLQYQPKSWLKKPIIGLTFSALITAGVSGCDKEPETMGVLLGDPLPPNYVHLSDHDALEIIADELANAGYELVLNDANEEFTFDGYFEKSDKKYHVEYVSQEEIETYKYPEIKKEGGWFTLNSSKNIADQLKEENPEAAIFYDPNSETPDELIRAQVFDYLEWLLSLE